MQKSYYKYIPGFALGIGFEEKRGENYRHDSR